MRRSTVAGLLAPLAVFALVLSLVPATPAYANATVVLVNDNAPGIGLNDPTPVAPVGGNTGTTLGQQRLNALQFAADIWGATIDTNVTVEILVSFVPLACNATGATLASAGTIYIWSDFPAIGPFPGAEFPATWYGQALTNKRFGQDVNPVPICTNTGNPCTAHADCALPAPAGLCTNADIRARFNLNLGAPNCLAGLPFYLGLDNNHGSNSIDVVTTALHEFGHGFGFQQFASVVNGSQILGQTDIYGRQLLDTTTNKTWNQMTNAERAASAINARRVVWTGDQVETEVPSVLDLGVPNLRVNSPGSIAGNFSVGGAQFGPPLTAGGMSGDLVAAIDPIIAVTSPTAFDACSPLSNAGDVAGKIALVDRGACTFVVKALNVQAAGAIGMVVADNAVGNPPPDLGGIDPTITIPAVRVTQGDGTTLRNNLASGVNVTMLLDLTIRAGADGQGRAQLNAPNPVVQGSSISHWDPITRPNQLMEPAINGDLTHNLTGVDLSLALMRDIGWFPDADIEGIADADDNCPNVANVDQADNDADNLGDVCDPDDDNDNVDDGADNCPMNANGDQADFDLDGIGDACDPETGPAQNLAQCLNGGWARFDTPRTFSNQGMCVCYVQTLNGQKCPNPAGGPPITIKD